MTLEFLVFRTLWVVTIWNAVFQTFSLLQGASQITDFKIFKQCKSPITHLSSFSEQHKHLRQIIGQTYHHAQRQSAVSHHSSPGSFPLRPDRRCWRVASESSLTQWRHCEQLSCLCTAAAGAAAGARRDEAWLYVWKENTWWTTELLLLCYIWPPPQCHPPICPPSLSSSPSQHSVDT